MVQLIMKPTRIEISYKTIVFTVLFLLALALLWQIKAIILLFFFCFLFMEALNPAVTRLEKFKIPRQAAILILYLLIIAIISVTVALIIPILIEQTTGLINALPNFFNHLSLFGVSASSINWTSQLTILENLPTEIARFFLSLFSNIFSTFIILVVTFYMLMERKNINKYSFKALGSVGRDKVLNLVDLLENRLGNWVVAELILMTVIGLLSYIGYTLIGLKYAVPLALMAGLFEAVPNIGPTITSLIAAIVGFTVSPLTALLAVVTGIIIQQLENNFIVPKIMKETVGLHPLITILVIAVGAKLGGVLGAIIALPVFLTLEVIFKVFVSKK